MPGNPLSSTDVRAKLARCVEEAFAPAHPHKEKRHADL
jgi:hypothetical protein